jgi:alkylation response protein AidB-like acyl-CoA dehydrogenase/alkanesulfonate monooxygenase SsuD/methylene tetrahydromethanopterin reductase-like flavin-dependent oxidoreductase (luciferase family)
MTPGLPIRWWPWPQQPRHPLLTARAVLTLQDVALGRFLLGVGAGWLREEFDALGSRFEGRGRRLDEELEIIRLACAGGTLAHQGEHYRFDPLQVSATAVPVPLIVGGNSPPALHRAALLGDGWFGSGNPSFAEAVALRARVLDRRRALGVDGPFTVTVRVTHPQVADLARYEDAGFDQVILWTHEVAGRGGDRRAALHRAAESFGVVAARPATSGNRPDAGPTAPAPHTSPPVHAPRRGEKRDPVSTESTSDLEQYAQQALNWLADRRKPAPVELTGWGQGSDDVSVFHNLTFDEEQALLARSMAWQQEKFDAGYGAITWPTEFGGAGLSAEHERVFHETEAGFDTPGGHETFAVTTGLVAPTIRLFGTPEQQGRFVRRFLRADELCCQLFSEPGSGSDLAGLGTRAVRDGAEWVISGQKVWSSGAQFSAWGELIARTDPDAGKHAGLTAFLVPLDAPGVVVRPIKQMSGGASFNEVFLAEVRLSDDLRLGAVGDGWKVALATLGFERGGSGGGRAIGGSWDRLLGLARWLDRTADPVVRQRLVAVYIRQRLRLMNGQRAAASAALGQPPGPEGSIGKLLWVQGLQEIGEVATALLGPRLAADTEEWGTFAWSGHVLGAPGYRIAGGSDEIQRNIIGERVLGLPSDVRADRGPWAHIPR